MFFFFKFLPILLYKQNGTEPVCSICEAASRIVIFETTPPTITKINKKMYVKHLTI